MTPLRDQTTWMLGDRYRCLQPPRAPGRTWHLVLLGPPGIGKGTQAALLTTALGACPLSTGDIFRAGCEREFTPGSAMAEAIEKMNCGQLVPDDVLLALLRDRQTCLHCHSGFILDGFPRTVVQATALDGLLAGSRLQLDAVVSYELPTTHLLARLAGRRVCRTCHAVYHLMTRPPRRAGFCDQCGLPLVQRRDDAPQALQVRLQAHADGTASVADYYRRQGLLLSVDASVEPQKVFMRTLELLRDRGFDIPIAASPTEAMLATA